MELLLWILAVILVVTGIVALIRGQVLWGIVLVIVGLLVGPGGVSILTEEFTPERLDQSFHSEAFSSPSA